MLNSTCTLILLLILISFIPLHNGSAGEGGEGVLLGKAEKAKLGESEDEIWGGLSRRMRKELTDAVKGVSGNRRFLVMFQDGCEQDMI